MRVAHLLGCSVYASGPLILFPPGLILFPRFAIETRCSYNMHRLVYNKNIHQYNSILLLYNISVLYKYEGNSEDEWISKNTRNARLFE